MYNMDQVLAIFGEEYDEKFYEWSAQGHIKPTVVTLDGKSTTLDLYSRTDLWCIGLMMHLTIIGLSEDVAAMVIEGWIGRECNIEALNVIQVYSDPFNKLDGIFMGYAVKELQWPGRGTTIYIYPQDIFKAVDKKIGLNVGVPMPQ